ncbi:MAG: diphthamide biosynthesis enzyme Dph2 [Methanocellales archaeon]
MDLFDYDVEFILSEIKKRKAKAVGLQFPDGLKRVGIELAKEIEEKTNATVFLSGNPCYGACDIDEELKNFADILIHFGHAELGIAKDPKVIFVEARARIDITPVVEKAIESLRGRKIGLITTVQHVHKLKEAKEFLEKRGKEVVIGIGDSRIKYPGQVLGCNFSSAKIEVEEYLYIGSGIFHALGAALASGKRIIAGDPFSMTVEEVNTEKIVKQRYLAIARALDAKTFGIIIGMKAGQRRTKLAEQLKQKAFERGKHAFLITLDDITPEALLPFKADAFVNTACPRVAIDDAAKFKVPVLTTVEFEIAIGERKWEDYIFDEITATDSPSQNSV